MLGAPDRSGLVRPTALFNALHKKALELKPVVVAIDTAADTFGASENDRSQVRQFVGLLRRLAMNPIPPWCSSRTRASAALRMFRAVWEHRLAQWPADAALFQKRIGA